VKDIKNNDLNSVALKLIPKGAFLTVTDGKRLNTMTIGWASFGFIWGKPIIMVMVRKSRYTYELMEKSKEFTVSFPGEKQLKNELNFCGTKSGREHNKFTECQLTQVPGRKLKTPIIGEAELHYECKIVYKQEMKNIGLTLDLDKAWYSDNDYHTLYFGEILSSYLTDNEHVSVKQ